MKEITHYLDDCEFKTFVKIYEGNRNKPNLIFFMTPICSVEEKEARECMEGLLDGELNVFAIDFPGVGKSQGRAGDLKYSNIKEVILKLISYIRKNYNDNIHIYGGTGTGGIIGQALVSDRDLKGLVKSYSQFGVANYSDPSIIGKPGVIKIAKPLIRLFSKIAPDYKVKFKIPDYKGYNHEKENRWYREVMEKKPGAFDFSITFISSMLELILSKRSPIKGGAELPILVVAAKYDRYYSREYVSTYYNNLPVEKKLIWVEDSHIGFLWSAREVNREVVKWVKKNA